MKYLTAIQISDWQASALYKTNDVVMANNIIYRCLTNHTSQSAFSLDMQIGTEKWKAVSADDNVIGARTADPATATPYSKTGTLTQWLSWIVKKFETVTGYAWDAVMSCSIKKLWEQPWTEKYIINSPADGFVSEPLPLSRDATMTKMDFWVKTAGSNVVITVKQNSIALSPTVTLGSTTGKTTLTFSSVVIGSADDIFTYTVAGAGLANSSVTCNQKWVNR